MSRMDVSFLRSDGFEVDLNDHTSYGAHVYAPLLDVGMPTVRHVGHEVFDLDGEVHHSSRYVSREVTVPVAIVGNDLAAVRAGMRALAGHLAVRHGEGSLLVGVSSDPTRRAIGARYAGGLEGELASDDGGAQTWMETALIFRCSDPYWTDATATTLSWSVAGAVGVPFFPMFASPSDVGPHLGMSSIFDDQEIGNGGDGTAWPIWTVRGPASNIVIANATSGEQIDLSGDGGIVLGSSETLTIDTRPGIRSVVHSSGSNEFNHLTDVSVLWGLGVGTTTVHVECDGATGATLITLAYRQRYLTL